MGVVEKTTEVQCHFRHIKSRLYAVSLTYHLDLDNLTEVVFARLFQCKFNPSSPPHPCLFMLSCLQGSIQAFLGVLLKIFLFYF